MLCFTVTSKRVRHAWLCHISSQQSVYFKLVFRSDCEQGEKEVRFMDWSHATSVNTLNDALFQVRSSNCIAGGTGACKCQGELKQWEGESDKSQKAIWEMLWGSLGGGGGGVVRVCLKSYLFWGLRHAYWNNRCVSGWTRVWSITRESVTAQKCSIRYVFN